MGYFLATRASNNGDGKEIYYRVVDSRGPWFLEASPFHVGLSVFYLVGAALKLLVGRFGRTPCLAHVNITGRGSTVRKVILVAFAHAFGLRYLLHVHDYDYAAYYRRQGPAMKSIIRWIFRDAETVLVLGAQDQHALAGDLELPRDHLTVVHNAVPDPFADLLSHEDAHGLLPPAVPRSSQRQEGCAGTATSTCDPGACRAAMAGDACRRRRYRTIPDSHKGAWALGARQVYRLAGL